MMSETFRLALISCIQDEYVTVYSQFFHALTLKEQDIFQN